MPRKKCHQGRNHHSTYGIIKRIGYPYDDREAEDRKHALAGRRQPHWGRHEKDSNKNSKA